MRNYDYSILELTASEVREKGLGWHGELYIAARNLLNDLASFTDNDEVFLLGDIKWAMTKEHNWLWESKFKDMKIRTIVEIVSQDETDGTNKLQAE
jgi:hypothetical protein